MQKMIDIRLIYKTLKIHLDLMSIAVEMKIKNFIIESRNNALKITISKKKRPDNFLSREIDNADM